MHTPYRDDATNHLYNLLFCDDLAAFAPRRGQAAAPWQQVVYGMPADAEQVRMLAEDPAGEARVRALAYAWLRQHGHEAESRNLLGVIIEVPLGEGLDVLAAYADGSVRYINQTGRVSIIESQIADIQPVVRKLLAASQAVVERIGPWGKPRLAAPQRNVRMSFIVSDGLYFGEGPMQSLMGDAMAGPVLGNGVELLQRVVDLTVAAAD